MALSYKITPNHPVEYSAVSRKSLLLEPFHQHASIFTAELVANYIAVKKILVDSIPKSLVISDDMSALRALDNCLPGFACTNNLLWYIKVMIHEIHNQHRDISFLWIPNHEEIKGN
ncbi:hypothetical protein Trydic_g12887 [Trypoxylus dichotomus]